MSYLASPLSLGRVQTGAERAEAGGWNLIDLLEQCPDCPETLEMLGLLASDLENPEALEMLEWSAFDLEAPQAEDAPEDDDPATAALRAQIPGGEDLTEEDLALIEELKARDAEVVRHEEAHATVGGAFAGSPTYEYQTGPDGMQYAVGGQVPIDVSEVPDDPQATIDKMTVVIQAALAPAEPSPQDYAVAGSAAGIQIEAQKKLAEKTAETGEDDPTRVPQTS